MSENDKETKRDLEPVRVHELDNRMVSDITLKELFQYIRDTDVERALQQRKKEYEDALKQFEETKAHSEQVFKDIRGLSMVTTPFRLFHMDDLNRFMTTCRSVLESGGTLVISMGVVDGGNNGVQAIPVQNQVPKA